LIIGQITYSFSMHIKWTNICSVFGSKHPHYTVNLVSATAMKL